MPLDRLRLIEEVRKRPLLWDCRNLQIKKTKKKCAAQWAEIGQIFNSNESTCKRVWSRLRLQFCNEAHRIPNRIARAKRIGIYDPEKKYYCWPFFDALRFLVDGISYKAQFDTTFGYDSGSDMEVFENNSVCQIKYELSDSDTLQTENDNGVELLECDNLDQQQTEKQKYENYYESDNDIEIIEDDNLDQTQCHKENCLEDNFLPKESDSEVPIHSVDGHKDTHFKAYTISLSSIIQDGECVTIVNDNAVLHSGVVIKQEPEKHLVENYRVEDKSLATSEHKKFEEYISSPSAAVENEYSQLSTIPDDQVSCSPGLSDGDYSFLYSFSSQTKAMTQLQKMEFRGSMKKLLAKIVPASGSGNILEKQLLLPEDNDPDRKFLISFWPFMKSMAPRQNLQFRYEMADLVLQILSNEAIL